MAKHAKGSKPAQRNLKLQNFNARFEVLEPLPKRALDILDALGAGNSQRQAAKLAHCCESNVHYWKRQLIAMGALRLQCRSESAFYSLTPYGSKILTGSENTPREVVGVEDYAVKFVVLRPERRRSDGSSCIDWRKLGDPRNWEKLGVKIGGVRVIRTPQHIIIHPGKVRGFDLNELKVRIGRIIEQTRFILENHFGMQLSEDYVPLHKLIVEFYSDEAKELAEVGSYTLKDSEGQTMGAINKSPPSRIGHEEYPDSKSTCKIATSTSSLQTNSSRYGLSKSIIEDSAASSSTPTRRSKEDSFASQRCARQSFLWKTIAHLH